MTSLKKALISAIVFVLALLSLKLQLFESGGILIMFVMAGAFFTMCIQSIMHFTGYKNGDLYEVLHDAENIEAQALTNLVTEKDEERTK